MLNTKLKILAKVLSNQLQVVISDLIKPEKNCKGKFDSRQLAPDRYDLRDRDTWKPR